MNAKLVSKKLSHTNVATTEKIWRVRCLKNADFVAILKHCAKRKDLNRGRKIHDHILQEGLVHKYIYIGSSLISLYVKCGEISKAQEVFDELPIRNVVSWTSLISGYVQCEHAEKALNLFDQMRYDGISPNELTFSCALKACGNIQLVRKGEEIHAEIQGSLENDVLLGTSLVDMYAKCGFLEKAREVFEMLKSRDVVAWTTLITAYRQHGLWEESLYCFEKMQCDGLRPNIVTLICILKVCGSARALDKGEKIHLQIIRESLLEKDVLVGNALVDMYAKCGEIAKAREVLRDLPIQDVVSWSALIAGYAQLEKYDDALECFEQMKSEGVSPNEVTFISVLKACGNDKAIDIGKQVHSEILSRGYLKGNIMLGNTLVDMYAKCGSLTKAHQVLENLPVQNVVSWNALITGYAQQERFEEALYCFERMQSEGISPDTITFICMLKVHGNTCNIDKGKQIHEEMMDRGLIGTVDVLGNALVDMYAKCGVLGKAQQMLGELPIQDAVPWNALVTEYTKQGQFYEALNCFERMENEGLSPDKITFLCVLSACSQGGLLEEGLFYLKSLLQDYDITPNIEQYSCMIDLFGRSGHLFEAEDILQTSPVLPDKVSWLSLLTSCRTYGNTHKGHTYYSEIT